MAQTRPTKFIEMMARINKKRKKDKNFKNESAGRKALQEMVQTFVQGTSAAVINKHMA